MSEREFWNACERTKSSKECLFHVKRLLELDVLGDEALGHGLCLAVKASNIQMIKLLIDAGIDLESRDRYQRFTPLWWAVHREKLDIVNFLLQYGADANAVCNDVNLLTKCIQQPRSDFRLLILEAIVEGGADVSVNNNAAAFMALQYDDRWEVIKILVEVPKDIFIRTRNAVRHFFPETVVLEILSYACAPVIRRNKKSMKHNLDTYGHTVGFESTTFFNLTSQIENLKKSMSYF